MYFWNKRGRLVAALPDLGSADPAGDQRQDIYPEGRRNCLEDSGDGQPVGCSRTDNEDDLTALFVAVEGTRY